MQPPDPRQQEALTLDQKFDSLIAIGQIMAKPAEAYLRQPGTVGYAYFNAQTAIGFAVMFLFIGSWNPAQGIIAFWLTAALLLFHKLMGSIPGESPYYNGWSWMATICRARESTAKSLLEPLLLTVLGFGLLDTGGHGIGLWLLFSAGGLILSHMFIQLRDKSERRAIDEAFAEQQYMKRRLGYPTDPLPHHKPPVKKALIRMALIALAAWLLFSGRLPIPRFAAQQEYNRRMR